MLRRTLFGVDKEEVARFVAENECVGAWLGKYDEARSRHGYAHARARLLKAIEITSFKPLVARYLVVLVGR